MVSINIIIYLPLAVITLIVKLMLTANRDRFIVDDVTLQFDLEKGKPEKAKSNCKMLKYIVVASSR